VFTLFAFRQTDRLYKMDLAERIKEILPMDTGNTSIFHDLYWDKRDKRMDSYPLMSDLRTQVYLLIGYVVFFTIIGPWLMKKREAFNCQKLIIAYNIFMVVINMYAHIQAWRYSWLNNYSLTCEPLDSSNTHDSIQMANVFYLYFATKYLDWIDTSFFLLRKKTNHLSFLHLYHHATMPIFVWPLARYTPGGHVITIPFYNTFVHALMYVYYTLAALGPKYRKYLWWKKYITTIQITQFIVGGIHLCLPVFFDCGFTGPYLSIFLGQDFFIFLLFMNFYIKSYRTKPKEHSK